jgi:hypothetical protein
VKSSLSPSVGVWVGLVGRGMVPVAHSLASGSSLGFLQSSQDMGASACTFAGEWFWSL